MDKITVWGFRWAPPFAKGLVRDLRVRWALEEAGRSYENVLVPFEERSLPGFKALQPLGQVPAYSEGDLTLFESGAIVLHIGADAEVLLPEDPAARARAT